MGLSGKLVSQISIKSDENEFYELVRYKTHLISEISTGTIRKVDLLAGQWGTVGSIICWHYIMNGETKFAKEVIESVDEEKKSITFKVIEGDVLEFYNSFKLTVGVNANGGDRVVTWTLEYEKKTEAVPDPHIIMNLGISMTKEIERHHLLVPN